MTGAYLAQMETEDASGMPPRRASEGVAADQLRSLIERAERLEEEKAALSSDLKDLFAEAKGNGFDIPTLKKILKLRKMDEAEREEAQHLLDTYCAAIGMQTSFNFDGEDEHFTAG